MEATERDPQLWRMAKSRAKFKSHLYTYLVVNALLWAIWFLTDFNSAHGVGRHFGFIPWPVWSTVFWGFGVFMQGIRTYSGFAGRQPEREYEKLVREREGR